MSESLLDVEGLAVSYGRPSGRVLSDVSLSVRPGEIVGVVGETGSGKTTLVRAVVGLVPAEAGRVTFDGTEVTALRGRRLRAFRRAGGIQLVFQDPLRSLDPDLTVAAIVAEGLTVAGGLTRSEQAERVDEALTRVGLDPALASRRPGQISGGQRQRVALARAIAVRPKLLLCDEPVSALDASSRNRVLVLLDRLRRELGVAIVMISHDLTSLAGAVDRVAVLFGGRLVEQGPVGEVFGDPAHPYTALLVASAPSIGERPLGRPAASLRPAPDREPWPHGDGCRYAPMCPFATAECAVEPRRESRAGGRAVACHHADTWPDLVGRTRGALT
ncbi:ABC transporter ATP-binding protein [Actinoallomurus purpureus]|uniref:ABC transporter ATP-binding protein n=1 Tax=Actinoallomurus purpureus TaxID=478114 RepID=UPI00209367EB|nr:ABC transporter ATP-binding protein [Actinoallomurus purpureus]MCO6008096.1 ABC transporter ATP-binding protein [Actinoallomurus purpureus]